MFKINIVEDDENINLLLKTYLENEGYIVKTFTNGEDAFKSTHEDVHLWVLDIMLGGKINGYDLIKKIKTFCNVPVVFLSARDHEVDRIIGLESGSDDYITKPFSPRELVLRVNKILNRVYENYDNNKILTYKNYKIDLEKRLIFLNEEIIALTNKEYCILKLFIKKRGHAYSRDNILDIIWEENYFGSYRIVDDTIRRLRKKMPELDIETIYGYGYRLK